MSMMSEFRDFAMRGNVVDMAVGIVIGGAFGKIVSSFVNDVLMPPIGLLLVIGLAIFAPYLSFLKSPDVNFIQPGERPPYPPSSEHWFGTDQDARDMFSRTIYGARTSLTVGFAAIAFGLLVGFPFEPLQLLVQFVNFGFALRRRHGHCKGVRME